MHFLGEIFPEIFPGVIGNEHRHAEHVNTLIIRRIDPNLAEIKRARIDVAHPRPFFSAVFRAKNAAAPAVNGADVGRPAFVALHDRHHDLRFARRNREADSTGLAGQTARAFFPGRAAVCALENSADIGAVGRRYSVGKRPRCALARIHSRVDDFRISRIERDIAAPGSGVVRGRRVQDEFPGLAAVSCLEQAAVAAIFPEVPQRRDVGDFRFRRMDDQARDRPAFLQADVRPFPAAIGGTINSIAPFR